MEQRRGGFDLDRINSQGSNYIRYENGIQICWGIYISSATKDKSGVVINFDPPFLTNTIPSYIQTAGCNNNNKGYRSAQNNYYQISNTSVTTGWYGEGQTDRITWVAIGRWK